MDVAAIVALVEKEVYRQTQKHLSDLQQAIVTQVWQGKKYLEIADLYGCTEGHAKDTGSSLWQLLSTAWGKKVTKGNFRRLAKLQLQSSCDRQWLDETVVVPFQTSFVGREQAIAHLNSLVALKRKVIVLQGEGGVGKTTLAQQFLNQHNFSLVLEVLMAKETENIVSVASVVEEWLQRDLKEDAGTEFGVTLARLKRYLEQYPVGILIDNLEPALDGDGRLIAQHRDYIELLRILASPQVKSTTIITSRDRLCEGDLDLEHYRLSGLDLAAWQKYFTGYQVTASEVVMAEIHRTYGGNAKAMGILCGTIKEDYQHQIEEYWQANCHDPLVETDLKNLVTSQLARLQLQAPQGYSLLCRLGCYRYQDLPQIPEAGLFCLLWDVPEQRRRVIKSLRNRSLLEFAGGKYWLHPLIQAEGRSRLQSCPEEYQQTQRHIANFLTESIPQIDSIQAGLTALEAYYHYIAIDDYGAAAQVILYSRENQWGQFLTLGTTLYRLGIIQPLLTAIDRILEKIDHPRHRSELNNILGDLYWTTGKVHQAIACQQETITTSRTCLSSIIHTPEYKYDLYYWRMLEVDSLLSLGLYHIDLWELSTAADLFREAIATSRNTKHHAWSEKSALGLALINSYLHPQQAIDNLVWRLYRLIVDLEDPAYNTGRFAYFMQILGQIFLNQQQIEPAQTIWQRAMVVAQASHYTQTEAKSLMGLGSVASYLDHLEEAQDYHQQAITLLDRLGAKCDLAAAYCQWGLTLKASNHLSQSQACFDSAIALYQQIPAPKQVARILELKNKANA